MIRRDETYAQDQDTNRPRLGRHGSHGRGITRIGLLLWHESRNCTSATVNVCGTNLTAITLIEVGASFTCPAEAALVERWTIQKADEKQEEVKEGGHLEIESSCKGTASIGGTKVAAELNPGCAVQFAQIKGQVKEVTGKVVKACTIKASGGICTISVPVTGNQGLGFAELADTEKGASLMELLIKAAITGITVKSSGLCGTKETKEATLEAAALDIWDVLWI